jgi:small subunit ribosomal protein S4
MSRYRGPVSRLCRREGMKLFLKGAKCYTKKCPFERRPNPPGQHGVRRRKMSEFGVQLREKQKMRRIYSVHERQFKNYFDTAESRPGVTGENLLRLLESRFDNVLVRLGFAASRRQARQMIRHGHWSVNGRRVDIPSYQLRPDDVITMKPNAPVEPVIRDATELTSAVPAWLQADHDGLTAKVLRLPERAEITTPVQEQLIVELYSK